MLLGAANLVSLFLRLRQILDAREKFVKLRGFLEKVLHLACNKRILPLKRLWGKPWEPGR